ncbi:MAG TPA: PQQ-binding-like beta-propeller repeat protein [Verrucomicrobiae bacterium]|nr:PQQ-binding-like beta-propeller repeat protein [Verrucomicrobiae bacterium]
MKTLKRWITGMVGCGILAGIPSLFAQDWPQWRGPGRDGKVTGFTAPEKWPSELKPKWKITVGAGDATPALVGDKLYVFTRQDSDEVTLCLNAADGKELWRDKYEARAVTGGAASHPGPRSSPAVAEGKVVTLGVGGVLSCLNAADGKLLWRKDEFPNVVPRFFTSDSPLISDGMVIAHVGGSGNGAMIAFDLATGAEKWRWAGEGPAYASPTLMTVAGVKQVVGLTEKSLVGIGLADGKLLWQLSFPPQGMAQNASTVIVDGQTVYYTGAGAGRGTKAAKIEKEGDGFTAKELWTNQLATQFNSPVLKNGLLFGLSSRGNLFCINAKTGEPAWTDTASHGNFGAMLDAGSVILALPKDGELIAFKPSDKGYEETAKIKLADTETYACPVIAGNRIFMKDKDSVALLSMD